MSNDEERPEQGGNGEPEARHRHQQASDQQQMPPGMPIGNDPDRPSKQPWPRL
jgi:hypothetical protein